jgi:hypothetical protein
MCVNIGPGSVITNFLFGTSDRYEQVLHIGTMDESVYKLSVAWNLHLMASNSGSTKSSVHSEVHNSSPSSSSSSSMQHGSKVNGDGIPDSC